MGAYVQYAIRGVTESRKWAEPCIYFNEDEACLPFPPCMKEETWIPVEFKRNSTVTSQNSTVTTPTPTLAPSTVPTLSPSWSPSLSPSTTPTCAPTTIPTLSPTTIPTMSPTTIPTGAPSMSPTSMAPTWTQGVCDGKKKGRCRNTEGCRYVNKHKGCQIRIRPCSLMNKKNRCKNSYGCTWKKASHACEEVNDQ